MDPILIVATLAFLMTCAATIDIIIGLGKMRSLGDTPATSRNAKGNPKVSIIVPACNEERCLATAARSLLHQDYDNFEVIVINDRSTDRTAAILSHLQKNFKNLKVLTIETVSPGWLGKTNAMHEGATHAQGDYLLFTDADVILERTSLTRAMAVMTNDKLDHLSLFFKNIAPGSLLNALITDAGGGLLFLFKPWKVKDPNSSRFMGVGAFNLVKRSAYVFIGGHTPIKMHPIDDIMLGKMVKRAGLRQDCMLGNDFVAVRWYESVREMILGLMKNVFALYNFNFCYALLSVMLIVFVSITPLWIVGLGDGLAQQLSIITVLVRLFTFHHGAKAFDIASCPNLWPLLTPYINIYIILKATISTIKNKGVSWRGTFYDLDELRKNEPIF